MPSFLSLFTTRTSLFLCLALAISLGASTSFAHHHNDTMHGHNTTPDVPSPTAQPGEVNHKLSQAEAFDRVIFLLNAHEFFPAREQFDAIAAPKRIEEILIAVANDEAMYPSLRTRAIDSLGLYPSETTRGFLMTWLRPPGDKFLNVMRHHAMMSIAQIEGEDSIAVLEPFLVHENIQLRLTAITALAAHAGKSGQERLVRIKEQDSHPHVQDVIEQSLQSTQMLQKQ